MRFILILALLLPFLYWLASDGLKARSRKIVLVPDLLYALSEANWDQVTEGFEYKTARLKNSLGIQKTFSVYVWRFDPDKFHISVVNQHEKGGSRIKDYREKANAILAINGGFFAIKKDRTLKASGLVVIGQKELSPYHKGAGSGLFYEVGGKMALGWARQAQHYQSVEQALQVGPMVVDPGGKNGISRNDGRYAKRTVLCQDFKGRFLVVIIDGSITLYDTGKLLSTSEKRGGLSCERALNLDGGPSTMVDYAFKGKSLTVKGRWPVVNALVIKPRK